MNLFSYQTHFSRYFRYCSAEDEYRSCVGNVKLECLVQKLKNRQVHRSHDLSVVNWLWSYSITINKRSELARFEVVILLLITLTSCDSISNDLPKFTVFLHRLHLQNNLSFLGETKDWRYQALPKRR